MEYIERDMLMLKAFAAFLAAEYEQCVTVLLEVPDGPFRKILFVWMAMERLGRRGDLSLQHLTETTLPATLIHITQGTVTPEQVVTDGLHRDELCLLHYYSAERYLSDRKWDEARRRLEACVATPSHAIEYTLAKVQLGKLTTSNVFEHQLGIQELISEHEAVLRAGRAPEALELATRAWDLTRQYLTDDDAYYRKSLEAMVWAHARLGDADETIRYLRKLTDIPGFEVVHWQALDRYLQALIHLLRHGGHHAKTLEPRMHLVELRRAHLGDDAAEYLEALVGLAMVRATLGDHPLALEELEEAAAILHKNKQESSPAYAQLLVFLGTVCFELNRYDEARKHLDAAISISGVQSLVILEAQALFKLAQIAFKENDLGSAHATVAQLEELGQKHPDDSAVREIVGHAQVQLAIVEGIPLSVPDQMRQGFDGRQKAVFLEELVFEGVRKGDSALAIQATRELLTTEQRELQKAMLGLSPEARRRHVVQLTTRAEMLLSTLVLLPPSEELAWLLWAVVAARKGLHTQIETALRHAFREARPELRSSLEQCRAELFTLYMDGPAPSDSAPFEAYVAARNQRREEVRDIEIAIMQDLEAQQLALPIVDPALVANVIPDDAVLVDFARVRMFDVRWRGKEQRSEHSEYMAIVATRGCRCPSVVRLGHADAIDELIGRLRHDRDPVDARTTKRRDVNAESAETGDLGPTSMRLRELVFDPLLAHAPDRLRWFIAADGRLHDLPFDVLLNASGQSLIHDHRFTYVTSSRVLLVADQRRVDVSDEATRNPLVIGAPDYDLGSTDSERSERLAQLTLSADSDIPRFEPLAGVERETSWVAARLGVRPLIGCEATKAAVKARSHPSLISIATHGYYLPNLGYDLGESAGIYFLTAAHHLQGGRFQGARLYDPLLRCGLALAGANTWACFLEPPEDAGNGLLTAWDIADLDLRHTALVFLSACESGRGQTRNLEGSAGMQQAFSIAGARGLVMTLWHVRDEAALTIVKAFYTNFLDRRLEPAEALREAKRQVADTLPMYDWASFVYQEL